MKVLAPFFVFLMLATSAYAMPEIWRLHWNTNFDKTTLNTLNEIKTSGPAKDVISAINTPYFTSAHVANLPARAPVVTLSVNGKSRAYPLSILVWHEIVNDTVDGTPVAITFSPLTHTVRAFKRNVNGHTLTFGVSGKLRKSNLVMYDHKTQSWWQQFSGQAIVGDYAGTTLEPLPTQIVSFAKFRQKHMLAHVLTAPPQPRHDYKTTPYQHYDSGQPFLFSGYYADEIDPMTYVVVVNNQAWPLPRLIARGEITYGNLRLTWQPGMGSALDTYQISNGREIGIPSVQQKTDTGWMNVPFELTFAFSFRAFNPQGYLHPIKENNLNAPTKSH